MPKTSKARRQRRGGNSVQGTGKASQSRIEHDTKAEGVRRATIKAHPTTPRHTRPYGYEPAVRGPESLIFPAMVALGCWGIVIYFLFLTSEANHILFGGMAVLMALLWTFSVGTRVRKLLQQRSV